MSLDITATDMFCGAGGSSEGVEKAGATLRFAANHWDKAVETHNLNFPNADHEQADISLADPRRWPTTDVLIASPECTNHSQARGVSRKAQQADLFDEGYDPAAERSRATMWCPPRFAEQHHYPLIIIENVVEARNWVGFEAWLAYWRAQNYEWKIVYVNSMHVGTTSTTDDRYVAQSRDRMYVVLWKKGNRRPDLELQPTSWCFACDEWVEGRQAWRNPDRPWGRYRFQYDYHCPHGHRCEPVVAPAARVIDWALPADRIGDRKRPLAEATRRRIEIGLKRFGYSVVVQKSGNTYERPGSDYVRAWPTDGAPFPTLTAELHHGLGLVPGFMVQTRHQGSDDSRVRSLETPMWTVPANDVENALVIPMRNHGRPTQANRDPVGTVSAEGNHHGLAFPCLPEAYYVKNFGPGGDPSMTHHISDPLGAVTARDHHALLIPYDRTSVPKPVTGPAPTVTTHDRTAVLWPDLQIDDCRFRMFEPHEIGRAMAFADSYALAASTKKDKVKLYGNAVTPPVMSWLFERAVESLS